MTRFRMAAAAVAMATFVLGEAHAEASDAQYRGCDGYGEAGRAGDGMVQHPSGLAHLFGNGTLPANDRTTPHVGAMGIVDCDAALASLPAKHWLRKVSLLSSRALHRMEVSDPKGALADLDLAVAAANGSTDPYYLRSLGWSLGVLRAYVLRHNGDQAQATALALTALAQRPYNRQAVFAVLQAMGPGADDAAIHTVQLSLARLIPERSGVLFDRAFETGNFAETVNLCSQLSPPQELGIVNARQANLAWRNYHRATIFYATTGMMCAYARAALGQNAEARATMEATRAKLASDTAPPAPLSAKDQTDREKVSLHDGDVDIRKRSADEGGKIIDQWARYVDLRIKVSEGATDEVLTAVQAGKLPHSWAVVDLLEALAAKLPKAKQALVPTTQALRTELGRTRDDVREGKPATFFRNLPEVETADRQSTYSEKSGWLAGFLFEGPTRAGFSADKAGTLGTTPVRYSGGGTTTGAAVEEMALLRAAELARAAGKKGVIVAKREDVERSLTTYYYGSAISTVPTGFESEIDVVFVDPANLPDAYKTAAWRVLDADEIYNALAPFYIKAKKK